MAAKVILDAEAMRRALTRMSHEVVEQNGGTEGLLLVGICTRGVPLAQRMQHDIQMFERVKVPCGQIDITLYRDDLFSGRPLELRDTILPIDITGAKVVLVDDVLYTGRTIRAALDALMDCGRPRAIEVAVLIDRGHRELPIRANYVGKNVPTSRQEKVQVRVSELDGMDEVVILHDEEGQPGVLHERASGTLAG